MRFYTFLFFTFMSVVCFSQVVAEGDAVLCEGEEGVPVTLTATAFSVDLTDANIYVDDTFGGVIDLNFDFNFYGNTYNQVVLSSNNYLSFNTANAGGYSGWNIGAPIPNNFEAPMNAILCPWQDIYPGSNGNGTIQYATIGEAPNRVFIASFCGIPMFSCTDICYSSQIKLFETTNIIETHIAQKVLCSTWNDGAAIHGLHNDNGTIAHVVTGLDGIERNFPNEWTCEDDGWRFTPNGNNDYLMESIDFSPAVAGTDIIWQDQFGNQVGIGSELIVFPTDDITYTAGASLCGDAGDWCGFEGGIEGDDVTILFESVSITDVDIFDVPCDNPNGGSAIAYIEGNGPYTYSWENSAGDEISTFSASLSGLAADTYQFTITTNNGCEDSIEIVIETDGVDVNQSVTGDDVEICETDYTLTANIPSVGESGVWTLISGQANIANPLSASTLVSNLGLGDNIFAWTLENECGTSEDEIVVNVIDGAPSINMPTELFCLEQIPLSVDIQSGEGQWSVNPQEGVFINDVNSTNTFALVDNYGEYLFTFEGCNGEDSELIYMTNAAPQIEDPGIIYCTLETEITVNSAFAGTWSEGNNENGNILTLNSSDDSALITVSDYGDYNVVYTSCGVSDTLELTFDTVEPYIFASDHQNCIFSIDLNVMTPDLNAGPWEQISGPSESQIIDPYSTNTQAVVSEYGVYIFSFTSCDVTNQVEIGVSCPISVPNSFSPNGDGVNDIFEIPDLNKNVHTQSVLYIYNKWGAVVFIDPNYGLDGQWWDGQTNYSDKSLSSFLPAQYFDKQSNYVNDGVYYYTLEVYNNAHQQKEFYSGDISIFSNKTQ